MSLPPSEIPQGAIRFNTDSQRLEFYAQGEWWVMSTDTPNLGRGVDSTPGVRGTFMGGHNEPDPSSTFDIIDYVNIASTGNAVDFGNLQASKQEANAFSSATRGFYFGGDPALNVIDTFVFASTSNATDFGDLTAGSKTGVGVANATRGIAYLGNSPAPSVTNVMNYVTMASTGAGVDFGDNEIAKGGNGAGCASPTRGIIVDGDSAGANIVLFNIATTGQSTQEFGQQSQARGGMAGASNATRGVFMGGFTPTAQSTIDYITISTLGDATNFGDLNTANYYNAGSASATRAISGGGGSPFTNTIEYIEIPTTGNAVDFGDLTQKRRHLEACSNGHGGL